MNKPIYGVVGDGLIAQHFNHYLTMLNIPFTQWSRKKDSLSPESKLSECSTILILISDDSIDNFINQNPKLYEKTLIHFSGSLSTDKAIGFHPLMSFSNELYTLKKYKTIPFIGSETPEKFKNCFPELENRYFVIEEDQKPLYHALCVLSGNLTTLLWQKTVTDFEKKLNLPKEVLDPYLEQVFLNIKKDPKTALTGPIKRKDNNTIRRNKKALKSRIWSNIYGLFNKAYLKELK